MAERHVASGKLYDDVNSKAQKLLGLYLETKFKELAQDTWNRCYKATYLKDVYPVIIENFIRDMFYTKRIPEEVLRLLTMVKLNICETGWGVKGIINIGFVPNSYLSTLMQGLSCVQLLYLNPELITKLWILKYGEVSPMKDIQPKVLSAEESKEEQELIIKLLSDLLQNDLSSEMTLLNH